MRPSFRSLCLWGLLGACLPAAAGQLVGGEFEYTVKPGDYLILIGARFGQDPRRLAQDNAVPWDALIHPGQKLRLNNRHIVPEALEDGILINVPQRMLYLFRAGKLAAHYPVGLGRPTWPTPLGRRTIRSKEIDKEWQVPPSIQAEMRQAGEPVLTRVPPGPENPLGMHWMGLKPGWWGIHGTNAPASVYAFRSHGCIRLHPDDAADLFSRVRIGEPVDIVYRPVLLAQLPDGAVYLEVHRDIYGRGIDLWQAFRQAAEQAGLLDRLDRTLASQAMTNGEGIAKRVGPRSLR
ncbi:MAG: L,D-transpeptidase family protein [Hydrogenophilaceae bacterium]|nr:L,D-transpeptidase family protein [Hydrogenophilaceae bacterium]